MKRRLAILIVVILLVTGISVFLNRVSFDSNFSAIDVISGATKHSQKKSSSSDESDDWEYSVDDIVLSDTEAFTEKTIITDGGTYTVLQKLNFPNDTLVILSDQNNNDYKNAVQETADYYENLGYKIEIRNYNETMMLSLAHAEHFDLFVLRREEIQ